MDFNENNESLEEKVCIHKLAAESQREKELRENCDYILLLNMKIPAGCMGYYKMGCYSCEGKENDKKYGCEEYFILPQ
jgi:hypothetical protein